MMHNKNFRPHPINNIDYVYSIYKKDSDFKFCFFPYKPITINKNIENDECFNDKTTLFFYNYLPEDYFFESLGIGTIFNFYFIVFKPKKKYYSCPLNFDELVQEYKRIKLKNRYKNIRGFLITYNLYVHFPSLQYNNNDFFDYYNEKDLIFNMKMFDIQNYNNFYPFNFFFVEAVNTTVLSSQKLEYDCIMSNENMTLIKADENIINNSLKNNEIYLNECLKLNVSHFIEKEKQNQMTRDAGS